ncbi:MAG: beta-lactamase family protein [Bacteroidetes bacterium]|nr:beta-lactamase family protein [Bacteroidota bacterium]MBU1719020.1 beta-lactamase family protein [Bacteroidota bacterium]
MKKGIIYGILVLLTVFLTSCHIGRYFWWNFAEIDDYKKFNNENIQNAAPVFSFPVQPIPMKFDVTEQYKEDFSTFEEMLEKNSTVAFLVIRNDSILYENYFNKYNQNTIATSFSVAKSIVSALIGIAVSEGKIASIDQPVTDYLTEMKCADMKKVTIRHILNMESGIRFNEGYVNPFGHVAKFYYGRNLERYANKLKLKREPGEKYEYASGNTQLLAFVIEKATGKKLAAYLEEKLWKPMGMESPASWSIDSRKHGNAKAFCCVNALPRDYAKIGRLYLNKGNWNGQQLVPQAWVEESVYNVEVTEKMKYHFQWRVLDSGAFFAMGVHGQFIYVNPAKQLIIVRNGKKYGKVNWIRIAREIEKGL